MIFNPIARALILDREGGRCFRCQLLCVHWPTDDPRRPVVASVYSIHHRRPRGMGGTTDPVAGDPSNGLLLCGSGTTGCHGWVESHRSQALADGYLVASYADPRLVPVRLPYSAELVWLAGDRYLYAAPQEAPC